MAQRNVDEFKMSLGKSELYLTKAGKEQLFDAFEEYVEAKIDIALNPPQMSKKSKELKHVEKTLKQMLDAIIIRVEE